MIRPGRHQAHWGGTKSVAWNRETISAFDLVLISTAHSAVNYSELGDWARCIVDTRNAMSGIASAAGKTWKG